MTSKRWQIIRALRAAADRLEKSAEHDDRIRGVSITPDCHDLHDAAEFAEDEARRWLEPDGEWPAEIGCLSWGVYVAVEVAQIDAQETMDGRTPRESGLDCDEWWEVALVDAWGPVEGGDV
jgi:hypothetical protein